MNGGYTEIAVRRDAGTPLHVTTTRDDLCCQGGCPAVVVVFVYVTPANKHPLQFCGHHWHQHEPALTGNAHSILDVREDA